MPNNYSLVNRTGSRYLDEVHKLWNTGGFIELIPFEPLSDKYQDWRDDDSTIADRCDHNDFEYPEDLDIYYGLAMKHDIAYSVRRYGDYPEFLQVDCGKKTASIPTCPGKYQCIVQLEAFLVKCKVKPKNIDLEKRIAEIDEKLSKLLEKVA